MGPSRSQVVIFVTTLWQDTRISNSHSDEVEIEGKKNECRTDYFPLKYFAFLFCTTYFHYMCLGIYKFGGPEKF